MILFGACRSKKEKVDDGGEKRERMEDEQQVSGR